MTISYNNNIETGEQEFSGDILIMGIEKKEIGVGNLREIIEEPYVMFSIPLLDVRDGGFVEVEYESKYTDIDDVWGGKKKYKKLQATGVRAKANLMEKLSNQAKGSKFIPKKSQFTF